MTVPDARSYRGFADLAATQVRGRDYEIEVRRRPASPVAVIAPHGGRIEVKNRTGSGVEASLFLPLEVA